ncbi:MAG: late competence development ComFB family protein [Thioalkalispiraceae bacterium]|jgi:hypothetical protein
MGFEGIHNYYEQLVFNKLSAMGLVDDENILEDIACIALNQLPARYVRHNVDMIFYMTADEHQKMHRDVEQAIDTAVEYLRKHDDIENRPNTINQ